MHPVAFDLSGVTVHWYGIFVAIGFMLGVWTAGLRGKQDGVEPDMIPVHGEAGKAMGTEGMVLLEGGEPLAGRGPSAGVPGPPVGEPAQEPGGGQAGRGEQEPSPGEPQVCAHGVQPIGSESG